MSAPLTNLFTILVLTSDAGAKKDILLVAQIRRQGTHLVALGDARQIEEWFQGGQVEEHPPIEYAQMRDGQLEEVTSPELLPELENAVLENLGTAFLRAAA